MDSQNTSGAGAAPPMDTSDLKTSIIAAWVVMTVLAFVTVCMRFYTRRLILHIIGVEDWLILIAMVCSCPAFADPSPRLPADFVVVQVLSIATCAGFIRRECRDTLSNPSSKLTSNRNFLWHGATHMDGDPRDDNAVEAGMPPQS